MCSRRKLPSEQASADQMGRDGPCAHVSNGAVRRKWMQLTGQDSCLRSQLRKPNVWCLCLLRLENCPIQ